MRTIKTQSYLIFLLALIILLSTPSCKQKDPSQITAEALEEFQDLRFGLFIHFGISSQLAGIWKQDTLPVGQLSEHIMRLLQIPRAEYHELAKTFNPDKFNPKQIVDLAKSAGMKYIVITAKHHDGFAMFDSDYDDYNIKDGTPYGKDLIGELSDECRRQGMKLGFYYSHTRDWDEYNSVCRYGNHWDWDKDDPGRNPQAYLDSKVKLQLKELLTNYGDVFCIWFDTPYIITKEQANELYSLIKSLQPSCLVNSRLGQGLGDYGVLGDNQVPPGVVSGVWETPVTMNHSWGFHAIDSSWKSSEYMITQLVDLASKNVNYLLNIGPRADGSIPMESVQRLEEIGKWAEKNREAIYATGPSPWFQEMDGIRITTGKEQLYITLLDPSLKQVTLYNLSNPVLKVERLGNGEDIPFESKLLNNPGIPVLTMEIPVEMSREILPVIRVSLEGSPEVHDIPTQMSTGNILLQAGMAKVNEGAKLQISGMDGTQDLGNWPYFATMNWKSKDDYLEWEFNVIEPGRFTVNIINVSTTRDIETHQKKWNTAFKTYEDYHKLCFAVTGQDTVNGSISGLEPVHSIRSAYRPEFNNFIGILEIRNPGKYNAVLGADFINPSDVDGLVISEIRLERLKNVKK